MWTAFQANALKLVFDNLNAADLTWAVVRNHEGLPERNPGKDVDLIIDKDKIEDAVAIIKHTLTNSEFTHYEHQRFESIWCFTFYAGTRTPAQSIKIDLLYGFVWRGAAIIDSSEIQATAYKQNGFSVPGRTIDGFLLLVKPLMTGGFIKEKYRADILRSIADDPVGFQSLIVQKFGAPLSKALWPSLVSGKLDDAVPLQQSLCRAGWLIALKSDPMRTLSATATHFLLELRRRTQRPPASMIAVVGPDGVGKTTFIDLLKKELSRILVKDDAAIVVQHFRPNVLPNLKRLFSGKRYDDCVEEFHNPHRAKPAGTASSLVRLVYYWIDYVLGYWLANRWACVNGRVLVFDRYFYDFIVDPRRSRLSLPLWVRKLFLRMTPQPDLVFFLDCDPGTVFARKQELSRDEIDRQLLAYRHLTHDLSSRFVRLDAHQPPQASCNQAVKQLIVRSFQPL